MRITLILIVSIFMVCSCTGQENQSDPSKNWSSYRGYYSSGFLDDAQLPLDWDRSTGANILWKVDIPGLGLGSPVIWGDKLFITTAVSEEDKSGLKTIMGGSIEPVNDDSNHEWKVYCINKMSGKILWEDTPVTGVPKIKRHPMSTHANTSMATDGKYAVAFFGSEGLFCYDMNGELLWEKNFGILKSVFFSVESAEWEFASSPIIHKGVVLIQVDVFENSFVAAFDAATGKELWKVARDEYPGWSTPNIYELEGKDIVVVNGFKHRGAYEFENGNEVWNMSGGGDIPIPTPIIGDKHIYFNSAHGRSSPILAVKKTAKGDITLDEGEIVNEGIDWSFPRGGSYMQTMLLYKGYIYSLRLNGQIQCIDALTGKEIYKEKIGKAEFFLSSPVAADDRIYITNVQGAVYTLTAGPEFNVESSSELGDVCMTTPAITESVIYFRTEKQIIAIAETH